MQRRQRRMRMIIMASGLLSMLLMVYAGYTSLFAHRACIISVDVRCSQRVQNALQATASRALSCPPLVYSAYIKETFLGVDDVCVYHYPDTVFIEIIASIPRFLVNEDTVVTADSRIVPAAAFNPDCLLHVPSIQMHAADVHAELASPAFLSWAKRVPITFLKTHVVSWYNHVEIRFYDKQDASFVLVADAYMPYDKNMFAQCRGFKERVCAEGKKSKTGWVADMRFAQQVVLYPGAKGA